MIISIIVPCKNEAESLPLFFEEMKKVTSKINGYSFEYIFVDDGSTDDTLKILKENKKDNFHYLSFTRNFGKEAALYAGLKEAKGDYVCVMDADLQDPPTLLIDMVNKIEEGKVDCVAAKRINRKGESVIRSFFAKLFYKLINSMSTFKIEDGARDFRLMSRRMVESVLELAEYNRFSKGIFNWVGFKTKYIEVENQKRAAGKTKWNFMKLFKYAIDGITSFSVGPLKVATVSGGIISLLSLIFAIQIVIQTLIMGKDVPGYASTITSVLFMGGIQLITIGILSEYVGKIYLEIKGRPQYIVKEKIVGEKDENNNRGIQK